MINRRTVWDNVGHLRILWIVRRLGYEDYMGMSPCPHFKSLRSINNDLRLDLRMIWVEDDESAYLFSPADSVLGQESRPGHIF